MTFCYFLLPINFLTFCYFCFLIIYYLKTRVWRNWQTRKIQILMFARTCRFKPCYPYQQKTHFCLSTKVRFLNDVCLWQMMLAAPMMMASPNDVWLRHILWQTSHHCGTKWSNIILSEAKNIISP